MFHAEQPEPLRLDKPQGLPQARPMTDTQLPLKDPAAVALGRKGGLARTPAKAAACRANGVLGGLAKHRKHREMVADNTLRSLSKLAARAVS